MLRRTAIIAGTLVVAAAGLSAPLAQETVMVSMGEFFFDPAVVAINSGDTVMWTNDGALPHTSTSGEPGGMVGDVFDSGSVSPGGSFSTTFDAALTEDYFCTIHPTQMFGQVIVDGTGVHGTMIPDVTSVVGSGPLSFTVYLFNFDAAAAEIGIDITATAPTGQSASILSVGGRLPAGAEISQSVAITLPNALPDGEYTIDLTVADQDMMELSSDQDVYTRTSLAGAERPVTDAWEVHWTDGSLSEVLSR